MTDPELEVYRALRDLQTRYTYFLLAAAGAGIALAVNQTQNQVLASSQIPLAAAVLAWAFSFFAGCKHIDWVSSTIRVNAGLLQVQSGEHPLTGRDPNRVASAKELLTKSFEEASRLAQRYYRLQFWTLILGAVFYVAWHVLEMYLRNPVSG